MLGGGYGFQRQKLGIVGWAEQREAQRDLITDIVGLHFVQPNLRFHSESMGGCSHA